MGSQELDAIQGAILGLSPADQLRLAAELLEAKRPKLAKAIIDRVAVELGAALVLASMRGE